MRKTAFLFLLPLLTSTCALAQSNELGVAVGAKVTPTVGGTGSQTSFSTTFAVEANFAHRLAEVPFLALHLELPLVAGPSANVTSNIAAASNYRSLFFTPSLRLKVAASAPISPWVSAGYGIANFHTTVSPTCVALVGVVCPSSAVSTTKGAIQGGAGLDFHAPVLPIAFRVEARDFYTGRPNLVSASTINARHNIFVGGGIVLRF